MCTLSLIFILHKIGKILRLEQPKEATVLHIVTSMRRGMIALEIPELAEYIIDMYQELHNNEDFEEIKVLLKEAEDLVSILIGATILMLLLRIVPLVAQF